MFCVWCGKVSISSEIIYNKIISNLNGVWKHLFVTYQWSQFSEVFVRCLLVSLLTNGLLKRKCVKIHLHGKRKVENDDTQTHDKIKNNAIINPWEDKLKYMNNFLVLFEKAKQFYEQLDRICKMLYAYTENT